MENSGGSDMMKSMKTLLTLTIALLIGIVLTKKSSTETTGRLTTNHSARSRTTSSASSRGPNSTKIGSLLFLKPEK